MLIYVTNVDFNLFINVYKWTQSTQFSNHHRLHLAQQSVIFIVLESMMTQYVLVFVVKGNINLIIW